MGNAGGTAGYRYLKLADEIEHRIKGGVYKAGDRLPSIRRMREHTGYSINTVYQAFIELEKRALVEPREKSGYYVKPLLEAILPAPRLRRHRPRPERVSINSLAASIVRAMGDTSVLQLGGTLVAPELLPLRALAKSIKSIPAARMSTILSSYENPTGSRELRRRIAARTPAVCPQSRADDIIVTNGCVEAVSLCLRATAGRGDTIIVESPTYPWFLQMIEDLNLLALELPTDPKTGIDLESVQRAIAEHPVRACILVPNFHNPLGFAMPEEHKRRLVEMTAARGIPIIEDDIHGELYFGDRRPSTLKAYDRDGLVLYCSSFSKTLAPGLRIGWTLPGRFSDAVRQLKLNHSVASPAVMQHATAQFLEGGAYDRHLRRLRTALKNQVSNMATAVAAHFPRGTRITAPEGGFVLWIELDPKVDSLTFYQEAQRHRIAILPGGMCSNTSRFNHFIRISCGFPWRPEIEAGVKTLGTIAHRFGPRGD